MQCWYLGALRAAEEMAMAIGDEEFAERCRKLFERGSRWTDENLFNGEYYEQRIDPEHPDYQFGSGCLIDQMVGQYMAHVLGLGHLLNPENIRSALRSIYRYNFKKDLYDHPNVMRTFALNDESATLICTWPKGDRPKRPFPYFSEVMTGFEYQFAVHMIYEDMVEEGIEVIESIRRRYDGRRRNPWNEAECGNHYARAMASWGAILALSGYRYSGVERMIRFAPKINADDFYIFWSAPGGWGSFRQRIDDKDKSLSAELSVISGRIGIKRLRLGWRGRGEAVPKIEVYLGDRSELPVRPDISDSDLVLNFEDIISIEQGEKLLITCHTSQRRGV